MIARTDITAAPRRLPPVAGLITVSLLAAILLFGARARAQTAADETATQIESNAPVPVPASQITRRAEETASLLRSMRDRPVPDDQLDKIAERLPGTLSALEDLFDATESRLAKSISSRNLDDLDRRWHRARNKIDGWRNHTARRAQSIEQDLEALQNWREIWDVTLQRAIADSTQGAVVSVIRTTLEDVRREEKRFGESRSELLGVGQQVSRAEDIVGRAFDLLDDAKRKLVVRLYAFDTPPLWEALIHPPPRAQHVTQILRATDIAVLDLEEFVRDERNWLIVGFLVFLILIYMLRSLNKRLAQLRIDEHGLEGAINVLSRPVSSSALLVFAFILLFYPNPPRIVDELVTVFCFVPLYRLLPRRVFKRIGTLMVWLVGLHVTDRMIDILPHLSLLKRLLLLILNTVTFAVLLRAIREGATTQYKHAKSIRTIEKIAAALLVVAFVSNVLGDLSLADMIVSAVIMSAYAGLVFYALFLVVDAIVRIGMRTRSLRSLYMVRRHGDFVHQRIMTVFRLVLEIVWLLVALKLLHLLPIAWEFLKKVLWTKAQFGDVGISLGGVLSFAVTVWAAFLISRIIRFVLNEDVFPRLTLPRGVPNAVSTGIHYIILLLAFFLAVAATGADLGKFALLAGALGVGIGFGLQNVVNNFISGLILIVERPIMPGDTIEFGNKIGDVKRIGLRASTIRTWSGSEVIVPNGNLVSSEVINWTLSDRQRRLDIPVGVSYGSPVKQVMDILASVASQHEDVLDSPAPRALFRGFGDSSLDFELRCWTQKFELFRRIASDITVGIEAALNDAGIVIPFPQRDLHIKTVESTAGRTLRGDEIEEPDGPAGTPKPNSTPAPGPVADLTKRPPRKSSGGAPPEAGDAGGIGDEGGDGDGD